MHIIDIGRRRKSLCAVKFDRPPEEIETGDELRRDKRFDDSGRLLLDFEVCMEAGLKNGMELDDDELLEIIERSDYSRAKSYGMWKLSFKGYSRYEMIKTLRPEYGPAAAEAAADRLCELGLINDEAYAARLAEKYINIKKCAPRDAVYKITAKGIDRAVAQAAVEELEPDVDAQLCELIESKYISSLSDEKGVRRTVAALARKGYAYGDIKAAVEKYRSNDDYYDD